MIGNILQTTDEKMISAVMCAPAKIFDRTMIHIFLSYLQNTACNKEVVYFLAASCIVETTL